jgi:hypothetical protein
MGYQHHAESESPTQFAEHPGDQERNGASIHKTKQHQRDAPREQQWKRRRDHENDTQYLDRKTRRGTEQPWKNNH